MQRACIALLHTSIPTLLLSEQQVSPCFYTTLWLEKWTGVDTTRANEVLVLFKCRNADAGLASDRTENRREEFRMKQSTPVRRNENSAACWLPALPNENSRVIENDRICLLDALLWVRERSYGIFR